MIYCWKNKVLPTEQSESSTKEANSAMCRATRYLGLVVGRDIKTEVFGYAKILSHLSIMPTNKPSDEHP